MAQGDSELDGTGIETSITGDFKITLIKAADLEPWQQGLDFPMGETAATWIVHYAARRRQLGRPCRDPQGHVRGGGVKSSCPHLSFVLLLCPHPSFVLLLFRTVAPPTPRAASDVCPFLSNSSVQVASLFRTVY